MRLLTHTAIGVRTTHTPTTTDLAITGHGTGFTRPQRVAKIARTTLPTIRQLVSRITQARAIVGAVTVIVTRAQSMAVLAFQRRSRGRIKIIDGVAGVAKRTGIARITLTKAFGITRAINATSDALLAMALAAEFGRKVEIGTLLTMGFSPTLVTQASTIALG